MTVTFSTEFERSRDSILGSIGFLTVTEVVLAGIFFSAVLTGILGLTSVDSALTGILTSSVLLGILTVDSILTGALGLTSVDSALTGILTVSVLAGILALTSVDSAALTGILGLTSVDSTALAGILAGTGFTSTLFGGLNILVLLGGTTVITGFVILPILALLTTGFLLVGGFTKAFVGVGIFSPVGKAEDLCFSSFNRIDSRRSNSSLSSISWSRLSTIEGGVERASSRVMWSCSSWRS